MTAIPSTSAPASNRNMFIIGGIIGVAVLVALAVILISFQSSNRSEVSLDYAAIPQSRLADGGFVLGNPDAPITIIEFADYACSHCQDYEPTVTQFINQYVRTGLARYEFRVFPTAGGQVTAFFGTIAMCFDEQQPGAFWSARDLLFQKAEAGNYDQSTIREVASELGVNYEQALSCAQDNDQVQTDTALGQSLGVNGTPAVRVRYGDNPAQLLTVNGVSHDRGGPNLGILAAAVEAAR
jgi:protein-disulfide isomerase